MGLLVVFLSIILVLAVLLVIPRKPAAPSQSRTVEDAEELSRAEQELADLNAMATPEDAAEELPDWGPGAPKYRKESK